jgi:hypothetical protein
MKILQIQTKTKTINRQRGIATLFVVLMLMFLMAVLALTAGKFAVIEQESAGAVYRSREAAEATTAGLEYALAWLDNDNECSNCVTGTPLDFEGASVGNVEMPDISYTGTGYSYNPRVTLTRASDRAPGFMLVESDLDGTGSIETGVTITGSEQVYATQWNQYLTANGASAPPIVVGGCMSDIRGNPTVYPKPNGVAILTLRQSQAVDWNNSNKSCLDLGGHMSVDLCHGDFCEYTGKNIRGIEIAEDEDELGPYLQGIDLSLSPGPRAWNYIFEISLADAKAAAAAAGQATNNKRVMKRFPAPTNDDYVPFYHYTGSGGLNAYTWGTPAHPVVLIMSGESCPKFNGGATVFGFLYYENPQGSCNGMGGATVVGTAVFEGDAEKLNSNSEFLDVANLGVAGNPGGPLFTEHAVRIPGSWRDW